MLLGAYGNSRLGVADIGHGAKELFVTVSIHQYDLTDEIGFVG